MWHWDQGHLAYFQFDALRAMSSYIVHNDIKSASRAEAVAATGLAFAGPQNYLPWRNYARALKLSLLLYERDNKAIPTAIAQLLARPGIVTCDEYFHFLAQVSTEPNPALADWTPDAHVRYPLLFALKYLLAKATISISPFVDMDEIIGAYCETTLTGEEDESEFLSALNSLNSYVSLAGSASPDLLRQSRESLRILCQISYLRLQNNLIFVDLDRNDSGDIFRDLHAVGGVRAKTKNDEIERRANLFSDGSAHDFFSYSNTTTQEVIQSGFIEGNKVQKTHVVIERNSGLKKAYFAARPTSICDVCNMDTRLTYPWADRIIDLHHLLPLCSGTRVESRGTTFDDLTPICPSCHRAVHSYYDGWFKKQKRNDFSSKDEALAVYNQIKSAFPGFRCA